MATDIELYEMVHANQPERKRKTAPALTEVGLNESLLMSIHELLQQAVGFAARQKKPKVKQLPRPRTAADEYARRQAQAQFEHFEQVLRYVSQEQFERTIAEAQGGE